MTRYESDAAEDWVEDDGPDEDDVLQCPSCGAAVHEDTQQCPKCRDWITPVYPRSGLSRWVWVAAVIIMIFLVLAVTLR